MLTQYKLFFLRYGRLIGGSTIDAPNDEEAIRLAADRANTETVEIWQENRRVQVVSGAKAGRRSRA